MRARRWRRYYWLDLEKLACNLLRPTQSLQIVRYFTASLIPDHSDAGKDARQRTYLDALETLPNLSIQLGYFQPQRSQCPNCGKVRQTYEEKMTDVNISVALLNDAQDNLFDTAMIISADSDLVGPIQSCVDPLPRQTSNCRLPTRPKIKTPAPSRQRIIHHRQKQTPRQPTPRNHNSLRRLPAPKTIYLGVTSP